MKKELNPFVPNPFPWHFVPKAVLEFNPRPPKEWWDKMYKEVKKTYSHATTRHPRITNKKRLSQITARIWWNISKPTREELIAYYDEKAKLGIKNPWTKSGIHCFWKYGVAGTDLTATPEQMHTWYLWGISPLAHEYILGHYREVHEKWKAFDDTKGGQLIGTYKHHMNARKAIEKIAGIDKRFDGRP